MLNGGSSNSFPMQNQSKGNVSCRVFTRNKGTERSRVTGCVITVDDMGCTSALEYGVIDYSVCRLDSCRSLWDLNYMTHNCKFKGITELRL